jgi:hypothetical protein
MEETTGSTEFTRIFYNNDPTLRLLEAVTDSRPLILPWDSGDQTQTVDESEHWELFTKMRKVLWDVPHSKDSIDYQRIVQELPPLGSHFSRQGGYFTPDNVCITRPMRLKVMEVRNEYSTERHEQNDRVPQQEKATVEIREVARPFVPGQYGEGPRFEGYFEGEPLVARHQPVVRQNRPSSP